MMHFHKQFFFSFLFLSSLALSVNAAPGDTTTVQAFRFGSLLEGKFLFPDSTHRWEKILMYYTLKCNPAQNPSCGEWDYLTYTYYYKHTGRFDSTLYSHPNFMINGATPDTLMYMNSTSWSYNPWFEYFNQTLPSDTGKIGNGTMTTQTAFYGPAKDSRTQILWKKDELLSAGLHAGQITALRFNFQSVGPGLKKLFIRLKSSTLDSLGGDQFQEGNFTEVYKRDHLFTTSGWQTLSFTYPFLWDGTSNIIVDISYEDKQGVNQNILYADDAGFSSVLNSDQPDFNLNFNDNDFVKVPGSAFSTIDSAITVAFWIYGDPLKQPQNNTAFEGIDSAGVRVVNVHLPWSDSKVYWDAGKDSAGYDRLNHTVTDHSWYCGKWNHWAFTKDLKSGKMTIYRNGQIVRFITGKHKRMKGIRMFRIGSDGQGTSLFYDGMIDDFSVWNKALSDTAIREFLYKDITPSNPDYAHLVAYYKFNNGSGFQTTDATSGNHTADLRGYPDWLTYKGKERFRNLISSSVRPEVVFEQGNYNPATLDSVLKVDTVQKPPVMIVLFGDTVHPYIATDTITKWPVYYNNYVYDPTGHAIDSTFVPNDSVLFRKDYNYYGKPFEVLERYELARYITPYGNNLSLGNGWTWIYDLTDYAPLLYDSVYLSSGNWQELLDVKFKMIEGTPPRDVLDVKNIYTGGHGYANASQHNLPPVTVKIGTDVSNARLKMRITGHGFGGNFDCSEFCPRTNKLFINGSQAYTHYVWRLCGINPLYPQGGTWLYDRAAWCPGAEVATKDFELSSFIVPGDSLTIDYDLQSGYTWNGQGSWPYYQIESQLITYSQPNFSLDAAMEEVLAPNSIQNYNRFNPMCGSPIIAIKNNGSTTLISADITYGTVGGRMQVYHWTGNLAFQDTTRITLPPIDWTDWPGTDKRFIFTADHPNGGTDQYSLNNTLFSDFILPPTYDNVFQLQFKTSHEASTLSWRLEDENGNIKYQNGLLNNNTLYTDTFHLAKGCYRFTIDNSYGEGLAYWANMPPYGNGTAGYAQLVDMNNMSIKAFQADFGYFIGQSFTVGMNIQVPELNPYGSVTVYPNPSSGRFSVSVIFDHAEDITVLVCDALGNELFRKAIADVIDETIPVDLTGRPAGVYFVTVCSGSGKVVKKVLVF
ncbi:MAG: peptide-N-glycosidase F-related protein [Bacteroidetes bacterium]|nr:peptide-N-glycosidase F-related protein [Bacteroidota bacterium]